MVFVFGEFTFDPVRRELRRAGKPSSRVDPLLLDLLAYFLANPGRLISKQELLNTVWEARSLSDNVLSVAVAKLRKVLGETHGRPEYIENRYGRGYRFLREVAREAPAPPLQGLPSSQPPTAAKAQAPLVGRSASRQRLETTVERAATGPGGLCVLIGEAGIGKTRLAESVEQHARALGTACVWGRYQPLDNAPPLWPFVQVMRELGAAVGVDAILDFLREHESRESSHAAAAISQDLGRQANSRMHRMLDETTRALFRLSKERPLVILLDDLHWADSISLRLLNFLIDEIAAHTLVVVATLRSAEVGVEDPRSRDLSRLLRHTSCERIELGRLHAGDVDEYVTAVLGRDDPELSRAVFVRSEGTPFFMVELLRSWEDGAGVIEPDQLQLTGVAQSLLRHRVRGVPHETRKVLSAAAVIGHEFDLGLLGLITERNPDELLEMLSDSLANDTIVVSSEIVDGYAFEHELVREVLYADLPIKERCQLHLRAGHALSQRLAEGSNVAHAELARHFLSALPQGDPTLAIAHARKAATIAHRRSATAQARALLRRALAALSYCLHPDPEIRTALLIELAMVERALSDTAYVAHLAQGVALAREHGLGAMLTVAGQLLSPAPGLLVTPDAAPALEAATEVLPTDDDRRRAIVCAHLSFTPPHCNSARRVRELLEAAELHANRSGERDAREAIRRAKLYFLAGPNTLETAEIIAAEIERDAPVVPARPGPESYVSMFRLMSALQRGDDAGAERALKARSAMLTRLGNLELSWHHERWLLAIQMNHGQFAQIASGIANLRERAKRFQFQFWREVLAQDHLLFLRRTGDVTALLPRIRPGLVLRTDDAPFVRSRKLRNMAEFGLLDDLKDSLAQLSVESLLDLPSSRDYLLTLCNIAFACTTVPSREHCEALYRLLMPHVHYFSVDTSMHVDGSVAYFLARLARTLGELKVARDHYEFALEKHMACNLRPCAVQTRIELAQLLRESGLKSSYTPVALLGEARAIASDVGMTQLAAAATQELLQRGQPGRRRSASRSG